MSLNPPQGGAGGGTVGVDVGETLTAILAGAGAGANETGGTDVDVTLGDEIVFNGDLFLGRTAAGVFFIGATTATPDGELRVTTVDLGAGPLEFGSAHGTSDVRLQRSAAVTALLDDGAGGAANLDLLLTGQFRTGRGSTALPSYSFTESGSSGMWLSGAGKVTLTSAGIDFIRMGVSGAEFHQQIVALLSSTEAAPSYSWFTDADTGFFHQADDAIGISLGGTERGRWTTAGLDLAALALQFGATLGTVDVRLRRLAANVLALDDGSGGVAGLHTGRVTQDHTVNDTLTVAETNKHNTNNGAVATVTLTLPAAPAAGIVFSFKRVAAFALRIDPGAADAHLYSGGLMADGEYLELAAVGSSLTVISNSDGNWESLAEVGSLTEENA